MYAIMKSFRYEKGAADSRLSRSDTASRPASLPFDPFLKVHSEPDAQGCVRLAHHWLQSCIESHNCVPSGITRPTSKTRFVDVGNHQTHPFLARFPPGELPDSWVALSYRWGNGPFKDPTKTPDCRQGINSILRR